MPELTVLFRDAALAVVDKPAGMAVESDARDGAIDLLARQLAPAGGGRAWPRVVHRLDRDTSGCLAVALNDAAARGFEALFERGGVRKVYAALVQGEPPDEGVLDTAYGKDPRDARRYTTRVDSAKRARLRFRVAERLRGAALLSVELDTGRTHQIRVQLAEAGFPLLGDSVYGVPAAGLTRTALHAERLVFVHPTGSMQIDCVAPVPHDLAGAIAALR